MNPLVIFIIVATTFIKGGAFLSLPFLTVYLQKHLHATPAMTGIVVGLNPLASMFVGFCGGYLSDRWGRKKILVASAFVAGVSFFSFSVATVLWQFALLNFLVGASAGSLQTSLKALLGDLTTAEQKLRAFRLQYFAINVGASVGPLVGAYLLVQNSNLGFSVTGGLFFVFAICFVIFDRLVRVAPVIVAGPGLTPTPKFSECVNILRSDKPFLLFICGSLLMSLTYSQIDTLLPQHLRLLMGDDGIKIFGTLLAANSATVIVGLYPSTWISNKIGALRSIFFGQLLMSLGFAALAFAGNSVFLLMLFMFVLTIGEILAFSNWSIVVDSFARPGLKGSYFGASGFGLIGACLGPSLGGFLFQELGAKPAFCLLALCSALGVSAYVLADRKRASADSSPELQLEPVLTQG